MMSNTLIKEKDVVVYRNEAYYSHNAVIEVLPSGELLAVVQEQKRRKYRTHIDPTSKTILLRSFDGGNTWDPATRRVIASSPHEAINDPGIKRLSDGTLVLDYFKWRCGGEDEVPVGFGSLSVRGVDGEHFAWLVGSYTSRSLDNGLTWDAPVYADSPLGDNAAVSDPVIELPDGDIMIPLYGSLKAGELPRVLVTRSSDKGLTWHDPVTVAVDPLGCFEFDEPSLLYLPSGKLICMIRVHRRPELEYGYYLYQCESADMGKTWTAPRKLPIWGHPPHIMRLQSGKLLCVYGYRRPAYGIRACLSHDEGATWDLQNELILRADGVDLDVGYPTSVQLADGRIFTIGYMVEADRAMNRVGTEGWAFDQPLAFICGAIYREK